MWLLRPSCPGLVIVLAKNLWRLYWYRKPRGEQLVSKDQCGCPCTQIVAFSFSFLSWQGPSGSLIHMPPWVPKELSCLSFSFSWSGKRDLVSCSRVVQSPLFGGFPAVDVNLKVWSLLSQWIERFASSPSGWVSLMSHWFESSFNASPVTVVSRPYSFDPGVLSPFYKSLLFA